MMIDHESIAMMNPFIDSLEIASFRGEELFLPSKCERLL